jgi:hypothetical protein
VINYHSKKANVVTDTLSQKNQAVENGLFAWDGRKVAELRKMDIQLVEIKVLEA